MYALYLDDSGSPGNVNEEYFVLGGVCIPEQSIRWLSHKIDKLADQYDPTHQYQVEFHAAETFRGVREPWSHLNRGQRIDAIKNVLRCLDGAYPDTVIFGCAIHKKSYPGEDPVIKAYEEITSRFDIFLRRRTEETGTSQRGFLILDKTSYESGLQNLAAQIRRKGNKWGGYTNTIVEIPVFVDSKASRNVQLADHIAYSIFRRYESADITYYNEIEGRFDQTDGVIHGLIHKQTANRGCTCPACLKPKM